MNRYILLSVFTITVCSISTAKPICVDNTLKLYLNEDHSVGDSVKLVEHLHTKVNQFKAGNNFYCWLSYKLDYADNYFQLDDYSWHIYELNKIIESPFFNEQLKKNSLTKDEAVKICKAYGKKAWFHYQLSEYNVVKTHLEQIERVFKKHQLLTSDFDLAEYCYKSLSAVYIRLGDNKRAIVATQNALKLINSYNILNENEPYDIDQEVDHYRNLARAYNNYAKYNSALVWINRGLSKKISSSLYADLILLKLEVITEKIKDLYAMKTNEITLTSRYLDSLNQVVSIVVPVLKEANIEQIAEYAYIMAQLKSFENPPNMQAVKYWFKKRLELSKNIYQPNSREIAKNYGYVGNSYLNLNQPDSAKHHFYLGLQTILPKFNPKQNSLPDTSLFFNENAIFENLEGLAEVFTRQDSLDLALQAYELAFYVKLKLRSIYDFESSKLYLQQKAKEVNSKAINVAWQLYDKTNEAQYIQRAYKIAESSRALVLLEGIAQNQLLKQTDNADSLFAEEKAKFDQPISLADLKTHLNKNDIVLEYFQADSLLYVFKIEQNKVPDLYKLKLDAKQLSELISTISSTETNYQTYHALAYGVYQKIIEPLSIEPNKKIIIIPDGQLNFLPFEALVTESSNKNFKEQAYLLKTHSISYQYSATIFAMQQQQVQQPKYQKILGIAPVSFKDTSLIELPGSLAEIRAIANIFQTDTLIKDHASKANVLDSMGKYNVLHFSTHAIVNADDRQQAQIKLYDDSLLLDELYKQNIHANLTVLSACETNLGKYEGGEGVMSLSRAFAYAGCPSLVATLWQANDLSTKKIIVEFYQNLKKGACKDEALQQAKLTYLKNCDDAHPFYWANLAVIGNTQAIESGGDISHLIYLGVLILIFIGVSFLYKAIRR